MTSQVKDWLEYSRLDLETISEIINNSRLTSVVAFHAQQSIEKSLKALILSFTDSIPRIHNIVSLFGTAQNYVDIKLNQKTLIMLNQAYTDTRYPREIGQENLLLPSVETAKLFQLEATNIFNQIEKIINERQGT